MRAASRTGVYELELPDTGSWAMDVECGGEIYGIEPPVIVRPADGQPSLVDALVVKSRGG